MEDLELRFKRIWKISEIIVGAVIVFGLVIIQLPITPPPNKTVIYVTAVLIALFTFLLHRVKLPISPVNINFIESVVDLVAIAVVVHVTGGVQSYFNFLYFLPSIDMAVVSTKRHTLVFWLLTTGFIFAEPAIFSGAQIHSFADIKISSYSLAILNSWAVGLVTLYGRFLAREAAEAQGSATVAVVEKERSINKLKDEFLFIISHELRGPITAIRGYLELFLTGGAGEVEASVKNLAAAAFRQGEHLNNLIAELLDISRLETGKLHLSKEIFDLNEFLGEITKETKPEADEKKIKFTFSPATQKALVNADKERIREVTTHLLENAIKFTGEFGQVWLWVEEKSGNAAISVADTGVGIPAEELPFLFERFYKGKNQEAVEKEGVGLGLFLIKELVKVMGGEVFVESKVGKGSTFTFTLPLAKPS
jgi:signal transduction histidine kinase